MPCKCCHQMVQTNQTLWFLPHSCHCYCLHYRDSMTHPLWNDHAFYKSKKVPSLFSVKYHLQPSIFDWWSFSEISVRKENQKPQCDFKHVGECIKIVNYFLDCQSKAQSQLFFSLDIHLQSRWHDVVSAYIHDAWVFMQPNALSSCHLWTSKLNP